MGRHADTSSTASLPRFAPRLLITAGIAVVLLVAGGVWWSVGSGNAGSCSATERVRVTVAPELAPVAGKLLHGTLHASGGGCVTAAVTGQQPLQTVANLGALRASALPQVWVPDASLWAARAASAHLTPAGAMASSPVVLATSRAAVDRLGWSSTLPTWGQVLAGAEPVALPDPASSAPGLEALGAVRASLGGNDAADNAVVAAVLAAARSTDRSATDALAEGRSGEDTAPLVPVSEQAVVSGASGSSSLAPVYPSDGSPGLDYPVLRVGSTGGSQRSAVDAVVTALTSPSAHTAVRAAGFRDPSGAAPTGAGAAVPAAAPKLLALDPATLGALLGRLAALSKPSRLLTVIDVSTSMSERPRR